MILNSTNITNPLSNLSNNSIDHSSYVDSHSSHDSSSFFTTRVLEGMVNAIAGMVFIATIYGAFLFGEYIVNKLMSREDDISAIPDAATSAALSLDASPIFTMSTDLLAAELIPEKAVEL